MLWTTMEFMRIISLLCGNTWILWPIIFVYTFGYGIINGVKGKRKMALVLLTCSAIACFIMYGDYMYSTFV